MVASFNFSSVALCVKIQFWIKLHKSCPLAYSLDHKNSKIRNNCIVCHKRKKYIFILNTAEAISEWGCCPEDKSRLWFDF